jgi:SAM-dependent methyltransferase
MTGRRACRLCGGPLDHSLIDLGEMPLANRLLEPADLARPERRYPLHARVCGDCLLVQVEAVASPEEIFGTYTYFSSYSASWVEHARRFAEMAAKRFALGPRSRVVEIASNDGYLLRHFVALGIPCLGIEPAANVAAVARANGVPTEVSFFGAAAARTLIERGEAADLVVANNVLAHVPDLNDFIGGLHAALKPDGVVSVEYPHVLNLVREAQFDTIYHEHFSYLSLGVVERAFRRHGLGVFDVEKLPTHGGSLRVYAARSDSGRTPTKGVGEVLAEEARAGLDSLAGYGGLEARAGAIRRELTDFLQSAKQSGQCVVAYGAAAKGITLLNYCRVDSRLVPFVVDRSPHKQGRFMPGCRLPIRAPDAVFENRPSYLLILPWNLRDEIMRDMAGIRSWGGKFVVAAPDIEVIP